MKWIGNKNWKHVKTGDGYHLKAEFLRPSKFWWIVYKGNEIVRVSRNENDLEPSLIMAQKRAQLSMIHHIKKTSG
ncbi:hypothetical protein [Spongiivirga citrea]|uniref:DUF1508 domain-containing protein n=1 Tax=Spongiivirga citrea TaxID=1481457 RepID=A0A6M0CHM8_9FLAO|nr:hypothetical protein [Spongiivirga citrea]NER17371.1 hypothetical protein [Spongiivirga citrea]